MSPSTKAIRLGSSDVLMFTFPTVVRFSRGSRKASSNGSSVHLVLYHCVSPPPCSRSDRKISLAINLHRKSHPIPPHSLLILSISDALDLCFLNTGVRGIPHLTRSIDPIPRRSESLYLQISFSIFLLPLSSPANLMIGYLSVRLIPVLHALFCRSFYISHRI